jgi:hypothetical protein
MENSSERVIGEIEVTATLSMGYERLNLFFTEQRIIASHRSKVGAGAVAPTFIFGSIGNAIGGLFGRKKGNKGFGSEHPSLARILGADKSNFSIFFTDIVSVDLTKGTYKNRISLLSKNDKYEFSSASSFERVRRLFEDTLGGKVRLHVEPEPSSGVRGKSDKPISHPRN